MAQTIRLQTLHDSEWESYFKCSETQLLHYREPEAGIFIAESPNVIVRAMRAGYQPLSFLIDLKQMNTQVQQILDACDGIPAYLADTDLLVSITGFHMTRGVLCAMQRTALPDMHTVCAGASRVVLLENIMNPTNLGAIFRSAAALEMDAVLLTSGCTDPLYRRACRVSMGAVFQIPWTYCEDAPHAADAVRALQKAGYQSAAMALTDKAVSLDALRMAKDEPLVLVFGTEGDGLHAETIAACDYIVRIPMKNGVDSLNVAAAGAVAFWHFRK